METTPAFCPTSAEDKATPRSPSKFHSIISSSHQLWLPTEISSPRSTFTSDYCIAQELTVSSVKPTHYGLDLANLNRESFTYDGTVKISLQLQKATSTISINSKQLTLHSGSVYIDSSKITVAVKDISYDKKTEIAELSLAEEIPSEGTASLTIEFSGALNHEMAGFYRSAYKIDGKDDWMYSTQFESCDARRAFPCFDEPNLKATFDFSIEIPENYTALSNQPEKESKDVGNGLKKVTFTTAPKMSTYLYAWACGELEYVESFTEREYEGRGKLPVRVYTTKGLSEQGRFALENACKIVDFFSEVYFKPSRILNEANDFKSFKIDYPLPKVDLLAVHEFVIISRYRSPPYFNADTRLGSHTALYVSPI